MNKPAIIAIVHWISFAALVILGALCFATDEHPPGLPILILGWIGIYAALDLSIDATKAYRESRQS